MAYFENAYALIIGINNYQYVSLLYKAVNDARDIGDVLTAETLCGYRPDNAHILVDQQATKSAFEREMKWLIDKVDEESTVTIFFSGHGAQNPQNAMQGYLLLYDTNPWSKENRLQIDVARLEETAVSTQQFTNTLNRLKARKITIFFDACHSAGFANPRNPFFNRQLLAKGLPEQYFASLAQGTGRVIIASSQPNQVSWEKPAMANGIFTYVLLKGLRGEAATAKGVQIFHLFEYLAEQVPQAIKDEGIIDPLTGQPAQQNPNLKADTQNNYLIAAAPTSPTQEVVQPDREEDNYDIFISYSHEDREQVEHLVNRLRADGFTVWLDDMIGAGDPLVRTFVDTIKQSAHVMPCLSASFLASKWTEFETAIARTMDINAQNRKLIPVRMDNCEIPLEFGDLYCANLAEPKDSRWEKEYQKAIKNPKATKSKYTLSAHDRVTDPIANESKSTVQFAKGGERPQVDPKVEISTAEGSTIEFENQTNALFYIRQQLTKKEPYVFITATAQMGKTYLLQELKRLCESADEKERFVPNLTADSPKQWRCIYVDLKNTSGKLQSKDALQQTLLACLNQQSEPTVVDMFQHAVDLADKDLRLIFLINGAEYMTEEVAGHFHDLLHKFETKLEGMPDFVPGVVAVGRRSFAAWENSYAPKMKSVALEPFTPDVIRKILIKAISGKPKRRDDWYDTYAEKIYQCTAGHPRCIAALIHYLDDKRYTVDPNTNDVFGEVIVPVIEKYILTMHNLVGQGETAVADYQLLSRIFLELSTYRIITYEIIEFVGEQLGLPSTSAEILALEDQIGNSLLVKYDKVQAWHVIPQTVRCLLSRWVTLTEDIHIGRHETAGELYHQWLTRTEGQFARPKPQGEAQIGYIREALYHLTMCLKDETDPTERLSRLEHRLREYQRDLRADPGQNVGRMLRDRLHEDAELRELIDSLIGKGAFNRLIDSTSTVLD